MTAVLRTYPFIFNYKSIHVSITEKEDVFVLECTSRHMIHTSYTPNATKGNKIIAKVNFSTSERLGTKENGVSMHITLNHDLNWFCSLTETEYGVVLEFNTGEHQFTMEQSLKTQQQYTFSAQIEK